MHTDTPVDEQVSFESASGLVDRAALAIRHAIADTETARVLSRGDVRQTATLNAVARKLVITEQSLKKLQGHCGAMLARNAPIDDQDQAHRAAIARLADLCVEGSVAARQEMEAAMSAPGVDESSLTDTGRAIADARASIQVEVVQHAASGLKSALGFTPSEPVPLPKRSVYEHAVVFWREGGFTPDDYVANVAHRAAVFAAAELPIRDNGSIETKWPRDPVLRSLHATRLLIEREWQSCGGQVVPSREEAMGDDVCDMADINNWVENRTETCPFGAQWSELADRAQELATQQLASA